MRSVEQLLFTLGRMSLVKYAILFVIIVGSYYSIFYDGGKKYDAQIKKIRQQAREEQQLAKRTQRLLAEKENILQLRDQLAAQFKRSLQALPPEIDVAELVRGVNLTAKSAGVKINTIRPSSIKTQEFYDLLPIDIEAQGSFGDMVLFLSYIARMPRIVRITDLSIKLANRRQRDASILVLESRLAGYRSRPMDLEKMRKEREQEQTGRRSQGRNRRGR